MKDLWYGDKPDLVKWSVLFRLAERYRAERILQIAYLTPSEFARVNIDGRKLGLPSEVIAFFRNVKNIEGIRTRTPVSVFDDLLKDRVQYLNAVIQFLARFDQEKCVVFLDPDTGLQPKGHSSLKHVLESEARSIWDSLKAGDVFAFYQHQTTRRGGQWVRDKKRQLERALGRRYGSLKVAEGRKIARDVVFYFRQKTNQ